MMLHLPNYNRKFIMGDFNSNMLSQKPDAKYLRSFMDNHGLKLINHGVTHSKSNSESWLDLIMVDSSSSVLEFSKTEAPFIAGHHLISAKIKFFYPKPTKTAFSFRPLKNIDSNLFNNALTKSNWDVFFSPSTIDERVSCLQDNIIKTLDTHAPIKHFVPSRPLEPWITFDLKMLHCERDRLYRKYKRNHSTYNLTNYRKARDLAAHETNKSRTEYYKSRITQLTDPKSIWTELKHLGIAENHKLLEPIFPLNELNNHYSTISAESVSTDIQCPRLSSLSSTSHNDFCFSEILVPDIANAIKSFTSEAKGTDDIPLSVIKLSSPSILTYLCNIYNYSLSTQQYPSMWKDAIITPIEKKEITTTPLTIAQSPFSQCSLKYLKN